MEYSDSTNLKIVHLAERIDRAISDFIRAHEDPEDWQDYQIYIDNDLNIEFLYGETAVEEDKFDMDLLLDKFVRYPDDDEPTFRLVDMLACLGLAEKYGPLFEFGAL